MTKLEQIQKAAQTAKSKTLGQKLPIHARLDAFELELSKFNIVCSSVETKPSKGASFSIIEMKDVYRVQIRCGYGKYNYAPCVEISK